MDINVNLDEQLTSNCCVKLVIELLKYTLYQKQQIPFAYDSLMRLQSKVKPTSRNATAIKSLSNCLSSTAEQLSAQFHLNGCKVKEIAILIGGTIESPKFQIRIELPSNILSSQDHFECKHTSGNPLMDLMRAMLDCRELQDAMTHSMSITNTYVLIQKSDSNPLSDFFLPKLQYTPPILTSTACFRIKLHYSDRIKTVCNCENIVKVYNEMTGPQNANNVQDNSLNTSNGPAPLLWYQSKAVIKGFKYVR